MGVFVIFYMSIQAYGHTFEKEEHKKAYEASMAYKRARANKLAIRRKQEFSSLSPEQQKDQKERAEIRKHFKSESKHFNK